MTELRACPFCRELFTRAEAERCPECDLALAPLAELPPSYEVRAEQAAALERTPPDDRPLPLTHLGRGRGALLAIALASLCVFFAAPWVVVRQPYALVYTGHGLARGPLAWLWGGAVAWLVTLALVLTRRSIRDMRGARPILCAFSAMTLLEVLVLLVRSPRSSGPVRFDYAFEIGVYLALALGVLGVLVALGFGGRSESGVIAERAAPADADRGLLH